jgi:hypothetical protein
VSVWRHTAFTTSHKRPINCYGFWYNICSAKGNCYAFSRFHIPEHRSLCERRTSSTFYFYPEGSANYTRYNYQGVYSLKLLSSHLLKIIIWRAGIARSVLAIGYGLDNRGAEFESRWGQNIFVSSSSTRAHPASYPMGTGCFFSEGKAGHSPPTSIKDTKTSRHISSPYVSMG